MVRRGGGRPRAAALATLLVALVGVIAAGTAGLADLRHSRPPAASDSGDPVDGYPQRIGFERPSPQLPVRPGPLAATLYDNDFGNGRTLAVSSRGDLWELPYGVNALSPDGRFLLTSDRRRPAQLVVHDLVAGERVVLDGFGQNLGRPHPRRFTHVIHPAGSVRWAPDGSRVLAEFADPPRGFKFEEMVLDLGTGDLLDVANGQSAGFRSPTQAVTVRKVGDDSATGGIAVSTTTLPGGTTQELTLDLRAPWNGDPDSPLVPSVSPDGSTLLLVEVADGQKDATLRLFSLDDGSELDPRNVDDWDGCSPTWLGDDPVISTRDQPRGTSIAGSELVTADDSRPLVAVHYRLQSRCLQLTPAALSAGAHEALFGTWTNWWTWYWWQLLLAVSVLLLVLGAILWRRQRPKA